MPSQASSGYRFPKRLFRFQNVQITFNLETFYVSSTKVLFRNTSTLRRQRKNIATNSRAVTIYTTTPYPFDETSRAVHLFALQESCTNDGRHMNSRNAVFGDHFATLEKGNRCTEKIHVSKGFEHIGDINAAIYKLLKQ